MKKKTRAKPQPNLKDLKAKKSPKGGGIIIHEKGRGSVNPSGWANHNETLVASVA